MDSTPDPFAADILYHKSCWIEHVLHNLNNQLKDSHLQNINIDHARKLFFHHVVEVIFRNREIRQLQWLLSNYKLVVGDYGLAVGDRTIGHPYHPFLIKDTFFAENFTLTLAGLPYSYQVMDLWIECTIILGSKLK